MLKIYTPYKISLIWLYSLISLSLLACTAVEETQPDGYFSVKIDGKLWQAKSGHPYLVSYKPLSHQLSIIVSGSDGVKMELSFHASDELKMGKYPSTLNDVGVQSGIFYFPDSGNGKEMASVTYQVPVQENTITLVKLDKSDPKAYLIEGTFSATLYALHQNNSKRTSQLVEGRFSVHYHPDLYNPEF